MRTVDLFCGCGGLSLGFQNAGYEIIGAFDFWQPAIDCYSINFNHSAQMLDLSKKNLALEILRPLQPEIIIGGPPCQDFSSAGERQEGDRASLTVSFAKIVKSLKPKYFVMENVSRAKSSKAYLEARKLFKAAGYGLTEQVLDASKCGVPQKRKRFFCIGALEEADGFLDQYLAANQSILPLTVHDYFAENHYILSFEHYYRHPRSYSRRAIFSVNEPAPTVRGVNRPKPSNYVKHPNDSVQPSDVRSLTTKERAILQTFPDDFSFGENQMVAEQMVGNAVPVNLAYHVARALAAYDRKEENSQSISFTNWLQKVHQFTPRAASDALSRIGRCNRFLLLCGQPMDQYLLLLEQNSQFIKISKSIQSQLKRSIMLYYEYKKSPHQK